MWKIEKQNNNKMEQQKLTPQQFVNLNDEQQEKYLDDLESKKNFDIGLYLCNDYHNQKQEKVESDGELAEDYWSDNTNIRRLTKMGTIKEEAIAYQPNMTLNVADLDEVPVDLQLEEREGVDKDGKTFKYKVFILNDKEYRMPGSVLEEIQTILKLKPSVTKVKVTKSGSGLATRYKVEALD